MPLIVALSLLVAFAGALPQLAGQVLDVDGRRVEPLAAAGVRATVFVFVQPDCPISNRYAPALARLHEEFGSRGVGFWLVYPGRDVPIDAIRNHLREYGYPFGALRDPDFALVDLAGATVMPEAAVFAGRKLLYRGRIDDRYVRPGRARPAPTRRDLEDALQAVLSERPVPNPRTRSVGCLMADLRYRK